MWFFFFLGWLILSSLLNAKLFVFNLPLESRMSFLSLLQKHVATPVAADFLKLFLSLNDDSGIHCSRQDLSMPCTASFIPFTDGNASVMYIRITYAVWISALHAEKI